MAPKSKAKNQEAHDKSSKIHQSQSAPAPAPTPKWPPINNILPAEDLSISVLLPDQILAIPNLWTSNLCKTFVNFLATLPLTTTPGKPRRGEAVRVNDRFQVNDADFAEKLWSGTALKHMVENPTINDRLLSDDERKDLWGGEVLGLNANIRIYRYSKGQFFDQHYDDSNNVVFPSASTTGAVSAKTTWTLLLYLTSPATGCIGGETVFYPDPPTKRAAIPAPVVAELEVGQALLHRHGKDCLLHEGREVTEGEKWIIRSDLCVKR